MKVGLLKRCAAAVVSFAITTAAFPVGVIRAEGDVEVIAAPVVDTAMMRTDDGTAAAADDTQMYLDGYKTKNGIALMKFDVSGIEDISEVKSAKLEMCVIGGTDRSRNGTLTVGYGTDNNWDRTSTYDDKPDITEVRSDYTWTTSASGSADCILGAAGAGEYISLDVEDTVIAAGEAGAVDENGYMTIGVYPTGKGSSAACDTYIYGVNSENPPRLTVELKSADYMEIFGPENISSAEGFERRISYSFEYGSKADGEEFIWSAEGCNASVEQDGTLIIPPGAEGTVTLKIASSLTAGKEAVFNVNVTKAVIQSANINGNSIMSAGDECTYTVSDVTDSYGEDFTQYCVPVWTSSDASVVEIDEQTGEAKALGNGTAVISAEIYGKTFTKDVSVKSYYLTSSEQLIDISGLVSYGSEIYRVTNADGEYTEVTASGGMVTNPYGGEVTVAPVYKFDMGAGLDGYINVNTANGGGKAMYSDGLGFGLVDSRSGYDSTNGGSRLIPGREFIVDLPDGYYDITIKKAKGARGDIWLNDSKIGQNVDQRSETESDLRMGGEGALYRVGQMKVTGGKAMIWIEDNTTGGDYIAYIEIARAQERKTHIFLGGDSTCTAYYPISSTDAETGSIRSGWGQVIGDFLTEDYEIVNLAEVMNTAEGWKNQALDSVLNQAEPGDYFIGQFGLNEASQKISNDVQAAALTEITERCREKGVNVILNTPQESGKSWNSSSYQSAMPVAKDVAEELGVPCVDLKQITRDYITERGESWADTYLYTEDNLHLTYRYAAFAAAEIATVLGENGVKLSDYQYTWTDNEGNTYTYAPVKAKPDSITLTAEKDAVEVYTPRALSAQLLAATYSGCGALESVAVMDLDMKADESKLIDLSGDFDAGKDVRVYLWDKNMQPLAEPVNVRTSGGSTPTSAPTVAPTTAPTQKPTAAPAPSQEPSTVLYSQDFESYAEGSNGGWTTPAGKLAVKSDTTDGIGKYLALASNGSVPRSGYVETTEAVDQNFVFECDFRSSKYNEVSQLQLLESRYTVYANHGPYSNGKYVFLMDRPKNENLYVFNNTISDRGFSLDNYNDPVFTTGNIEGDPWLHVKVVGNFDTHTVILYLTSLDGSVEYYRGMGNMSPDISSWKCIHMLSPNSKADTCIDNIVVRTATAADLAPVYHNVTMTCKAYSFDQYVEDGKNVVNIPDVSSYGEYFMGWSVDNGSTLYTSEELAALEITKDCVITGVVSEDYIENLAAVEFNSFPAGNQLVPGADENTYGDNEISLTITGEQGTSLVTSPDSRVGDYTIEWSFDGFRTLDGKPTGEEGSVYCDSYGLVEITEKAQSSVNFKLKRTAANYWGLVTAKVTYNGKSMEVSRPLVLLGDKSGEYILPRPGYTSDFSKYEDTITDHRFISGDVLSGGWETSGSDGTYMNLKGDASGKYLSLSRALTGNSSYVHNNIGEITTQTVFEQDIRFGLDATLKYIGGSTTSPSSTAFELSKSGSNLSLNGNAFYSGVDSTKWYHIAIVADPTSGLVYAKLYDADGGLLAQSDTVDFKEYTSGSHYEYVLSKSRGSLDVNNIMVYEAETDADSFSVTAPETLNIPESGTAEAELTVTASTIAGDAAIGKASWEIADELAEGVSIESTGNQSARLTVDSSAASGELPVRVSIGGKSYTTSIKLTGTKDNVAFVTAPAGIRLGNGDVYTYTAEVRNGQAETIEGREIIYSLCDGDGNDASYPGVSVNAASGELTVESGAAAQTIFVKASSTDSDGNPISRIAKTVLYNLAFSFGNAQTPEGYTNVTASAEYNENLGYGFEGVPTDSAEGVTGSGFTFKLKLEKGKVYEVTAKYNGTIQCERIDSKLTGFTRTMSSLGTDTYQTAVFGDDIMDITLPSAGTLASITVKQVEKSPAEKPDWWTIGDSTVQQSGSWGYTIASSETTDLSKYPAAAEVFAGFHNSGKAGENHMNYYSNGRLNSILTQMNPGDVVSISGMGVNDSSSTQEQFEAYNRAYIDAVIDMGGYVILGSYTPTGNFGTTQGKVYDSDTMTFKGMRTDAYDLAIRAVYEEYAGNERVLGFIDIGRAADEMMTADVKAAYNTALQSGADETAARAAANEKAAEMMAWWKDYNHYYTDFSNYILPYITEEAAKLAGNI